MALSADTPRSYEIEGVNEIPVAASSKIYEGSAVGDNGSGYAQALTAADPFLGFALAQADNSGGSAGDINVRMQYKGLIKLSVTGATIDDVGKPVYATDDGTFTLTRSSGTFIGYIHRYVSSGVAIVSFDATRGVPTAVPIYSALVTTAGGSATESVSIAGILATDVAVGVLNTAGSVARTISSVKAGADKVDIVFSDDPSDDHIVNLVVYREVEAY